MLNLHPIMSMALEPFAPPPLEKKVFNVTITFGKDRTENTFILATSACDAIQRAIELHIDFHGEAEGFYISCKVQK